MQNAIKKAAALIEALPYIRAFRGKVFVIKFGGAAMEDNTVMECVLDDVMFLSAVGIRPLLVHGGGPAISRRMQAEAIKPRFVHGHRVTDEATLAIVKEVLVDDINAAICKQLNDMGGKAEPVVRPEEGVLLAERRVVEELLPDGTEERLELGLVGNLVGVDVERMTRILDAGGVPVLAPLARGPEGETLNCNADMVAAAVAAALSAEKAVFLSDTHGIRMIPDEPGSLADTLTLAQVDELVRRKVISGGMLPKVDACRKALDGGVKKTHIVDGRLQHSLLLEIFTDRGVGTQIIH